MTTYYKAVRPDGRDFHSGTIDYGAALLSGEVVRHPAQRSVAGDASTYLSVATVPTDCTGMRWPCRLLTVVPVGRALRAGGGLPNKRRVRALRVTGELPAWQVFGPHGQEVAAVIDRARTLTGAEIAALGTAWVAAGAAAWAAARDAAWAAALAAPRAAAWVAAWVAAWDAARDAALAELTRDLITPEQYATLTGPWRSVVGDAA